MAKKPQTQVEGVASTLAALTEQNFHFLMSRFDRIEAQNDQQLRLLSKHVEEDNKVHAVVERHSTYFGVISLGIPVAIAAAMNKLGWKGL